MNNIEFTDGVYTVSYRGCNDDMAKNGWLLCFDKDVYLDDDGAEVSGMIKVEPDGTVSDYDGVFELPQRVIKLLENNLELDCSAVGG